MSSNFEAIVNIRSGKIEEPQDEDCLFLNIWTQCPDNWRRPVMVWIHGGAFIIGSGSDAMYRNSNIVTRGDVVLVTINYRISCLKLVEAQCNNNQPAYNYLFKLKSPMMGGVLGACHALEIGFVFGNFDRNFCGSGPAAEALSRKIQDA